MEIDFLPASYREQRVHRRVQVSRLAVLAVIGGMIGSAAIYQHVLQRRAERDLAAIEPLHAAALAEQAQLADLQRQLRAARARAELYTYLRHPWPRTQILHAVAARLPEAITLSAFKILREPIASQSPGTEFREPKRHHEDADAKLGPAERDLKQLRDDADQSQTVVLLSGHTTDAAALHHYLERLGRVELFSKAELNSLESLKDAGGSSFVARLIVRPGYGQPGGPAPAGRAATRENAEFKRWNAADGTGMLAVQTDPDVK